LHAIRWLTALAMRLVFAYGSTHWFRDAISSFSIAHQVPQNAYAAAFVLMVLTTIDIGTAAVLARGHAVGADLNLS
jgi:TRAP-type C4-dicarboxylate transport system permease small subunit